MASYRENMWADRMERINAINGLCLQLNNWHFHVLDYCPPYQTQQPARPVLPLSLLQRPGPAIPTHTLANEYLHIYIYIYIINSKSAENACDFPLNARLFIDKDNDGHTGSSIQEHEQIIMQPRSSFYLSELGICICKVLLGLAERVALGLHCDDNIVVGNDCSEKLAQACKWQGMSVFN